MRFFLMTMMVSSLALAKAAPPFQGEAVGGGKISLKEKLQPNRVLLLTFWATWCSPCLEELTHVTSKLKNEPALPMDVLTVNVDTQETSSDVKPTLKQHKFEVPVILDPKHEIFTKYHEGKTLPYSVLIGSDGQIAETFNGYHEEMFTKIKQVIAAKAPAKKEVNAKTN